MLWGLPKTQFGYYIDYLNEFKYNKKHIKLT
jgi:hypothetical protein